MMRPYLIITHDWTRLSGGVRALHHLAHEINLCGLRAYVTSNVVNPHLNTPYASQEMQTELAQTGIVVYPEVEAGNRLNARRVVRYLLNIPGLIRGDTDFPESELLFAYSGLLGRYLRDRRNILNVPLIDTTIFKNTPRTARSGSLFWRGIGKPGANTYPDIPGAREITFEWPESWHALAAEFLQAEWCYTYQNYTLLHIEARLCGCPCVIIPNDHYSEDEMRNAAPWGAGLAWGTDKAQMQRAQETVLDFPYDYEFAQRDFRHKLMLFIEKTQEHFK